MHCMDDGDCECLCRGNTGHSGHTNFNPISATDLVVFAGRFLSGVCSFRVPATDRTVVPSLGTGSYFDLASPPPVGWGNAGAMVFL